MIKYSLKGKFVQYSLDSLSGLSDLFTELLENAISEYSEQTVIGVLSSLNRVDISLLNGSLIPSLGKYFKQTDTSSDDEWTTLQVQKFTELSAVKFLK